MASAAAIEDSISCCICFNVYRNPHALPCLHTLCKQCIDQLAVEGEVECPECRETSEVSKIRKDFKTQSLIDAHNSKDDGNGEDDGSEVVEACDKGADGENEVEDVTGKGGVWEVCGMCRDPAKLMSSHCTECEHFMCAGCEETHQVMKVCRGHTVRAVKDIIQIAQSKLEDCVDEWKAEQSKISAKAQEIENYVQSVQDEAKKQIELTNEHFDKLIHNFETKRSALVNEIRDANEVAVEHLRENKDFYDKLSCGIESKIDMLQEVINGKHASTMNSMVDVMGESLKEQVMQIRKETDSFDVEGTSPVKLHFDENIPNIDTGIKLEIIPKPHTITDQRSYGDYSQIKSNKYVLNGSQDSKAQIYRICIIQDKLWCAAYKYGIQVYDKNMQLIKQINLFSIQLMVFSETIITN